eukprot:TRINITY_DN59983_c0_g1_i1.p1 TRINITY_DN59983_c0_g1~~TRINITY_DN59983_c0_g1_i1.p1  ORF type:complete len:934 (+),score=248.50 TRINITY_DN59983_c0_g1_i1:76-2802(+)
MRRLRGASVAVMAAMGTPAAPDPVSSPRNDAASSSSSGSGQGDPVNAMPGRDGYNAYRQELLRPTHSSHETDRQRYRRQKMPPSGWMPPGQAVAWTRHTGVVQQALEGLRDVRLRRGVPPPSLRRHHRSHRATPPRGELANEPQWRFREVAREPCMDTGGDDLPLGDYAASNPYQGASAACAALLPPLTHTARGSTVTLGGTSQSAAGVNAASALTLGSSAAPAPPSALGSASATLTAPPAVGDAASSGGGPSEVSLAGTTGRSGRKRRAGRAQGAAPQQQPVVDASSRQHSDHVKGMGFLLDLAQSDAGKRRLLEGTAPPEDFCTSLDILAAVISGPLPGFLFPAPEGPRQQLLRPGNTVRRKSSQHLGAPGSPGDHPAAAEGGRDDLLAPHPLDRRPSQQTMERSQQSPRPSAEEETPSQPPAAVGALTVTQPLVELPVPEPAAPESPPRRGNITIIRTRSDIAALHKRRKAAAARSSQPRATPAAPDLKTPLHPPNDSCDALGAPQAAGRRVSFHLSPTTTAAPAGDTESVADAASAADDASVAASAAQRRRSNARASIRRGRKQSSVKGIAAPGGPAAGGPVARAEALLTLFSSTGEAGQGLEFTEAAVLEYLDGYAVLCGAVTEGAVVPVEVRLQVLREENTPILYAEFRHILHSMLKRWKGPPMVRVVIDANLRQLPTAETPLTFPSLLFRCFSQQPVRVRRMLLRLTKTYAAQVAVDNQEVDKDPSGGLTREQLDEIRDIYNLVDTDGDGEISRAEFRQIALSQAMPDAEMDKIFNMCTAEGTPGQMGLGAFTEIMRDIYQVGSQQPDDMDGGGKMHSMLEDKGVLSNRTRLAVSRTRAIRQTLSRHPAFCILPPHAMANPQQRNLRVSRKQMKLSQLIPDIVAKHPSDGSSDVPRKVAPA